MLRHHIYTLLFLFFVGMIFSSCEEEYVFDTDDFESKLVVNSLLAVMNLGMYKLLQAIIF